MIRTLVFSNADATPKNTTIRCDTASVPDIMAWYGAYCAGDRYTVALDGRNVRIDGNGEPVGDLP
ncbi:hypothetical protein SAMN04489859_1008109 [Paracoccus alcaliphilus]|uniref:Uncharacterized protein n=1 Tax=Paracoccus alcaliphilus TaxID=34002 RepID=A0A1H8H3K5_9RHOB|nr:hypothetical protein [Paracoccus alcaliphilus]WCR17384.1 hypothetical protein JHW40_13685 [Paracoccus alcaliphilus]SEN50961.1 hypothetical protein SAMN04489859_1008109 [Paracoccus alcaliphilus]